MQTGYGEQVIHYDGGVSIELLGLLILLSVVVWIIVVSVSKRQSDIKDKKVFFATGGQEDGKNNLDCQRGQEGRYANRKVSEVSRGHKSKVGRKG